VTFGFEAQTAKSSAHALDIFEEDQIDVFVNRIEGEPIRS